MGIIDQGQGLENDQQALERYRYLLRTAPPEDLERAHAEAFARLTPQQRQLVLQSLGRELAASERNRLTDDPQALARAATRAELRQPGTLERTLGAGGGGMFSSLAGAFLGSAIAHSLFGGFGGFGGGDASEPSGHEGHAADDDSGADGDDGDYGGGDDFGDFGADV